MCVSCVLVTLLGFETAVPNSGKSQFCKYSIKKSKTIYKTEIQSPIDLVCFLCFPRKLRSILPGSLRCSRDTGLAEGLVRWSPWDRVTSRSTCGFSGAVWQWPRSLNTSEQFSTFLEKACNDEGDGVSGGVLEVTKPQSHRPVHSE